MDWNNLQEEYDNLGTYAAVAKLHGCSVAKVQNEMNKRGVLSHHRTKNFDDIAELYEHMGIKELCKYYRCNQRRIYEEFEKRGITPKTRGNQKGYVWSQERRDTHRKATSENPEWMRKNRENLRSRPQAFTRGPSVNSPLEKLLHGALQRANLSFETQVRLLNKYIVDILLLQKQIVIEADGENHKLKRKEDWLRDYQLRIAGYTVFRFNAKAINSGPDACIQHVITTCELRCEPDPEFNIRNGMIGQNNPHWSEKITLTCSQCGSSVQKTKQYAAKYEKAYCNMQCYTDWKRVHPEHSPVHARWAKHRANEKVK